MTVKPPGFYIIDVDSLELGNGREERANHSGQNCVVGGRSSYGNTDKSLKFNQPPQVFPVLKAVIVAVGASV